MEYNRFFNLHIPKTGGTYFRENILSGLLPEFVKNGIQINPVGGPEKNINDPTFHWCWYEPFVQNNSYIFTILRDPAKRLVSHYAWQAVRAISEDLSENTISDITVENFYKWFEEHYLTFKDFQSKNLTYYSQDDSLYKTALHLGWKKGGIPIVDSRLFRSEDFVNFKIDTNQLNNNVKRINLLIDNEDFKDKNKQELIKSKILLDFNLSVYENKNKKEVYGHQNHLSQLLFNKFTKKQISDMYDHSKIDSDLYFSDIYTDY